MSGSTYRADIDGLRALAVLSVVIYHAFPSQLAGGFVGVDIFFVISGFLISTIIYKGLEKNTFSFGEFYSRRVRRIFPALVLVLLFCFVFGWLSLLADEFKHLGTHIASSAGFIQNITLWKESGYFDSASDLKPLLHIWSLGIEEQFYFMWPVLLWISYKKKYNFFVTGMIVAGASFYLNIKFYHQDPVRTFYLPQTRLWELLAGALLAYVTIYSSKAMSGVYRIGNLISILGLALFLWACVAFNKDTDFPGLNALIPVLAGIFIIGASPDAFVNKVILSNKALVWIGLISYPLYLWHWPLLSFARIFAGEEPSQDIRFILVGASILLAWLTVRFVEKPLRHGGSNRIKVGALCSLLFVVGITGVITNKENGFPLVQEEAKFLNHNAEMEKILNQGWGNCKTYFPHWHDKNDHICSFGSKNIPNVLLIGDSHANHLYPGLFQSFGGEASVGVLPASCAAPFIDVASATKDSASHEMRKENYLLINSAIDFASNQKGVKVVILAHNPECSLHDAIDIRNPGDTNFRNILARGLDRTLAKLVQAQKRVIIVLDNPSLPFEPSLCKKRPFMISSLNKRRCSFPRDVFDRDQNQQEYRKIVYETSMNYPSVQVFEAADQFCDKTQCYLTTKDGILAYEDRDHVNFYGSQYIANPLSGVIRSDLKE